MAVGLSGDQFLAVLAAYENLSLMVLPRDESPDGYVSANPSRPSERGATIVSKLTNVRASLSADGIVASILGVWPAHLIGPKRDAAKASPENFPPLSFIEDIRTAIRYHMPK